MKKLALLFGLFISTFSIAQIASRIEQFGDTMYSSGPAAKVKTVMNSNGFLFTGYIDNANGGKITVTQKIFNPAVDWTALGTAGFSAGAVGSFGLCINGFNWPVVAYTDASLSNKVVVQEWNGSSWNYIGSSTGITAAGVQEVDICLNTSNNRPNIAIKDPTAGGKITVMEWDGLSWNNLGGSGISVGIVSLIHIGYSSTFSQIIVAYKDSTDLKAHSRTYGGFWGAITLGAPFSTGDVISLDMKINPTNGFAVYAVSEFTGSYYSASAYEYNGTNMALLGYNISPMTDMVSISPNEDVNFKFIAYRNLSLGKKVSVIFYDGASWSPVSGSFPTGIAGSIDISMRYNGEFLISYTDSSFNAQVNTRRLVYLPGVNAVTASGSTNLCPGNSVTLNSGIQNTPTMSTTIHWWLDSLRWDTVGVPGLFGNTISNNISYAATSFSSNKYVAVQDGSQGNKLFCYWHGGGPTAWNLLGPGALTTTYVAYPKIKLNFQHLPYIAFQDGAALNKLSVLRFNGSAWVNVGSPGVSAGAVSEVSLALTPGSQVVTAFQDASVSGKLTVMYFDGTNWTTLGGAGISPGNAYWPCVNVSPLGEIYVAYSDGTNSNKGNMLKWDGTSWITVGTTGFTPGGATNITFDFDGLGNIYLAYSDVTQSGKISTMTYLSGGPWSTLTTGFSAGSVTTPKIFLDFAGTPYVSYIDNFSAINRGIVKRYNSGNWDTLAHKAVTNTDLGFFEADLGADEGIPVSAVASDNNTTRLSAYTFAYNVAGTTASPLNVTQPGSYMAYVYNNTNNFVGTLSPNDVIVNVAPSPTVTATATNDTICAGLADTLVASGATAYTWYNFSSNDSLVLNPSATATYSVVGTNGAGCTDTAYVSVTVPTNGFTGTITNSTGPVNNGLIYLMHEKTIPNTFDTTAIRSIPAGGIYNIDTIPDGNFLVKAIADSLIYTTTISTYNGNVGYWDSATVVPHNCLNKDTINIQVLEEYLPTGSGLLGGFVYEGAGFGLRVMQGPGNPDPSANVIPGVPIKVGKNPSGAIVGGTYTDQSGYYSFDSLPCDSYYVYTDIPGYPMDTLYKVTISCTGGVDTVLNLNYFIDSNSVYIDLSSGIGNAGIKEKNSFITVYPNPSNGHVFLKLNPSSEGDLEIFVNDISGKEVLRKSIRTTTALHAIDLSATGKGIYLLRAIQNGKTSVNKIIIY